MITKTNLMTQEIAQQCLRARKAENELLGLQQMLDALGVVLWKTDRDLRLMGSYGSCVAECYLDRHIEHFYRDVYGIEDSESDSPVMAHRDARAGQGVTIGWRDGAKRYAMIVEPNRDKDGAIIGTVALSLPLNA